MRRGEKHVALFMEIRPDGLDEILGDGFILLKFKQFEVDGRAYFAWIVFRDGYVQDALRLKDSKRPATLL